MSVLTPNMSLVVSTIGIDSGLLWEQNLNADLSILDAHNHTPGMGAPIPPSGININSDLSFANNQATNMKAVLFQNQSSLATVNALYTVAGDLYFNDPTGAIQMTIGGAVNATSSGIVSGAASAAFSGGVLVVNAAANTPANIQCGSVLLGNNSAASNFLTLAPPAAMAASFNLTLPSLPASTKIMALDSSGNMSGLYSVDNSTITISANVIGVPSGAIGTTQLAALSVTAAKVANATLTGTQMSSNINLPGTAVKVSGANVVASNTNNTNGLTVLRGSINSSGSLISGEGLSIVHSSTGVYTITFQNSFSDVPSVVATAVGTVLICTMVTGTPGATVSVQWRDSSGTLTDTGFFMIAMGQR